MLTQKERDTLRKLATQMAELSELPIMAERAARWKALNDLKSPERMVMATPEGAWREIEEQQVEFQCTDPTALGWERCFHRLLIEYSFGDDIVLDRTFGVGPAISNTGFGVELKRERTDDPNGSFKHVPPITDLKTQFSQLKFRKLIHDRAETARRFELAHEVFDGILDIRPSVGYHYWSHGLTRDVLDIVGMEILLYGMYDQPEEIHRLMQFLSDDSEQFLAQLEAEKLLHYNNANVCVGSGTWGLTNDLPSAENPVVGRPILRRDLWGFGESQETVGVSPEMFAEFIWPYQKVLLKNFGLVYYGCCEPVEDRLPYLSEIKNLRYLSVSPWSNLEKVTAAAGKQYVLAHKPNPGLVCVSFCEKDIRADIRRRLDVGKDNFNMFILKDTHTISNDPKRFNRWIEIVREEFAR